MNKMFTSLNYVYRSMKYDERKGTKGISLPAICHPVDVANRLWRWGILDTDVLKAAILHDIVEDVGWVTVPYLKRFGKKASMIVDELTFNKKNQVLTYQQEAALKHQYIQSFSKSSVEALVIKLADRIGNCQDSLVIDLQWTREYFHKADPLWDALTTRSQEIIDKFGYSTLLRIRRDFDNLMADVG